MKKRHLLRFAILAIGLMVIIGYGCSSYSDDLQSKQKAYLDFDPFSHEELTPQRIEVLSEAILRMSEFVSHDGTKIHINTTANDINISERLFTHIYNGLSIDTTIRDTPLVKSRAEYTHSNGINYSSMTITLDLRESVRLMEIIAQVDSADEFSKAAIAAGLGSVAGYIFSGFSFYKGVCTPSETRKFIESGATSSTFTIHQQFLNGMNLTHTSYFFSY